jgi:hypothetical protein
LHGNLKSLVAEGVNLYDVTVIDLDGEARPGLESFVGLKVPNVQIMRKKADCVDDGNDVETGVPCPVLQSNYDMSLALVVCGEAARAAGKEWMLFVEDDVVACAGSIEKILKRIEESRGEPETFMVRFSKGAMGYALRIRYMLDLVADIRAQALSSPHDIVVVGGGWINTASKITFQENLFHHVGEISTIGYRNKQYYRDAYSEMRKDVCGQSLL